MTQFTMAQATRELNKLKDAVEARQAPNADDITDIQGARWIAFTLYQAARGADASGRPLSAKFMSRAKSLHFTLYGTPEIDTGRFGLKQRGRVVCIDGGKPNQLAPLDGSWPVCNSK